MDPVQSDLRLLGGYRHRHCSKSKSRPIHPKSCSGVVPDTADLYNIHTPPLPPTGDDDGDDNVENGNAHLEDN